MPGFRSIRPDGVVRYSHGTRAKPYAGWLSLASCSSPRRWYIHVAAANCKHPLSQCERRMAGNFSWPISKTFAMSDGLICLEWIWSGKFRRLADDDLIQIP